MWREDRAPALARLDQPQILRQLFFALCQSTLAATWARDNSSLWRRIADGSRVQARTTTTRDSAHCYFAGN